MAAKNKKPVIGATLKPVAKAATPVAPVTKIPAPATKAVTPAVQPTASPAQRQKLIEVEAYYLAEKNGFKGEPASYWAEAEKIVSAKLGLKK